MTSNGKLLILAKKVAASAKPVKIPKRKSDGLPRKHFTRQINARVKQTGERM